VVSKAAFTPGQHVAGNKQHVAENKIVASLLPVCCCIQRDTCCRDTSNMLPLPRNMLLWCIRGLKLYMLLLLHFFNVFLKIQKVTFYVFCFVAYVFSNYATNSSDSLHGLWSLDCSTVFCFTFRFVIH